MRRLAMLAIPLLVLGLAVPAAAQTEPPRLAVTATSDDCAEGLPVVNYSLTNKWSSAVSVQAWWVADASVSDLAGTTRSAPPSTAPPGPSPCPSTSMRP